MAIGAAGLFLAASATTVAFVVGGDDSGERSVESRAPTSVASTTADTTSPAETEPPVATTSTMSTRTPSTITPNEPGGALTPSAGDDLPPEATGCVDLPPIPANASITGQLSADVDGDGRDDLVTTYRRGGGAQFRRMLRVELADQGFEQPFGFDTFPRELAVVAAANLDDRTDLPNVTMELLVVIGGTVDHELVGVFYAEGCVLRRAKGADGDTAEFAVGEVADARYGLRCDEVDGNATFVVISATAGDDGSFAVSERSYRYALDHFEDLGKVTVDSNLEGAAATVGTLDC
jgi:hypothetical protein